MFRSSIRTKILTIAVGLIILMVITAALSLTLVTRVGHRLEQLTNSYIPAYGHLARANIRSLERALALRRMVIAKTRSPPDLARFSAERDVFDTKGADAVREGQSARALIKGLIEQGTSFADGMALARIETRIDAVLDDVISTQRSSACCPC
jgi:Tar ligand binding domain homologue